MRVILSKDRPAQLDLLLRSLETNAWNERTRVVALSTDDVYGKGYAILNREAWGIDLESPALPFAYWINYYVQLAVADGDPLFHFLCDDDVFYRPFLGRPGPPARDAICTSLRLGSNTTWCYAMGVENEPQVGPWLWADAAGDFGYPGSVDGHVFRTADVADILSWAGHPSNPTALEVALVAGCEALASFRPYMTTYGPESFLVGNPTNRVSEQSGVRAGETFPTDPYDLAERFVAGERIALEQLDFERVNGAHTEIEFVWEPRK